MKNPTEHRQKCIYCGSEDLSSSDIIPYALTIAKCTCKHTCKKCNNFTSQNFEEKAIINLAAIRFNLGFSDRKKGQHVKMPVTLIIDGDEDNPIHVANYSGGRDLLTKKILSTKDGQLIVPTARLAEMKKFIPTKTIRQIEFRVTTEHKKLFFDDEALRLIAKIAYEWYCKEHKICTPQTEHSDIREFILQGKGDVVSVGHQSQLNPMFLPEDILWPVGGHGIFEMLDNDNDTCVFVSLFGIVLYKVKIAQNTQKKNDPLVTLQMDMFCIDKRKLEFPTRFIYCQLTPDFSSYETKYVCPFLTVSVMEATKDEQMNKEIAQYMGELFGGSTVTKEYLEMQLAILEENSFATDDEYIRSIFMFQEGRKIQVLYILYLLGSYSRNLNISFSKSMNAVLDKGNPEYIVWQEFCSRMLSEYDKFKSNISKGYSLYKGMTQQ